MESSVVNCTLNEHFRGGCSLQFSLLEVMLSGFLSLLSQTAVITLGLRVMYLSLLLFQYKDHVMWKVIQNINNKLTQPEGNLESNKEQ